MGEAKNITWADCDFKREEIIVRGDPDEGTKNSEIRRVPIIAEMRELLERLRQERPDELANASRNARDAMRIGDESGREKALASPI